MGPHLSTSTPTHSLEAPGSAFGKLSNWTTSEGLISSVCESPLWLVYAWCFCCIFAPICGMHWFPGWKRPQAALDCLELWPRVNCLFLSYCELPLGLGWILCLHLKTTPVPRNESAWLVWDCSGSEGRGSGHLIHCDPRCVTCVLSKEKWTLQDPLEALLWQQDPWERVSVTLVWPQLSPTFGLVSLVLDLGISSCVHICDIKTSIAQDWVPQDCIFGRVSSISMAASTPDTEASGLPEGCALALTHSSSCLMLTGVALTISQPPCSPLLFTSPS